VFIGDEDQFWLRKCQTQEENHIVKIRSSEDNTFKDYESIDGKFPYGGLYGAIKMELQSIKITINDRSSIVSNDLLPSINAPKFCSKNLLKSGFEAYQDVDDIYLYVSGGNAANAYFGKLIFNQSSYVTSIMVDYWPLIPILFLDDGKGFRIVQNGSRQKT